MIACKLRNINIYRERIICSPLKRGLGGFSNINSYALQSLSGIIMIDVTFCKGFPAKSCGEMEENGL